MTASYRTKLEQLLELDSAASPLRSPYEVAIAATDKGDLSAAARTAQECHSKSLELFGDIHPVSWLFQFFNCDLLAQSGQTTAAVSQLTQVFNALVFVLVSKMPEGDQTAASLLALFFETAVCSPEFRLVLSRFDEDTENLKSLSNIATALMTQATYQASLLLKIVLETRRQTKGDDDESTLLAAHKLGVTLITLGQYEPARSLTKQTFETRKRLYGFGHLLTLRAGGAYASALYRSGFRTEALALQREICKKSIEINGPEHEQTQVAFNNLRHMERQT